MFSIKRRLLAALLLLSGGFSLAAQNLFTGDGGKGLVIAVPTPEMPGASAADNWMPQLMQDLLTGDFARFSAMTVVDRASEQLVLAEQRLSESGLFSDEDFVSIGNMTNARRIVIVKIQKTGGRYSVSFRINDIETNEIRAAYNGSYTPADIESGHAAHEGAGELLAQMGVALTDAGKAQLLGGTSKGAVKAVESLAKGMAAEKSGDIVGALSFYIDALDENPALKEAAARLNFDSGIATGGIKARAVYAQTQKAKWEKIFDDLREYVGNNIGFIVYDFSKVEDKLNSDLKTCDFKVSPGVAFIPNTKTLRVWKSVMDTWAVVKSVAENEVWTSSVRFMKEVGAYGTGNYKINIGLYDDYSDMIKDDFNVLFFPMIKYSNTLQIPAQQKRLGLTQFKNVDFRNISVDSITDNLSVKIYSVEPGNDVKSFKLPPVMSVDEYKAWVAGSESR